jgi:hypothetical protein
MRSRQPLVMVFPAIAHALNRVQVKARAAASVRYDAGDRVLDRASESV